MWNIEFSDLGLRSSEFKSVECRLYIDVGVYDVQDLDFHPYP